MKVLIKESQPLTAFGIHQLLENEFEDVNVHLASSIEDTFSLFDKEVYDICIIDTELPLFEMKRLIEVIKSKHKKAKILIYGSKNSSEDELAYISMGASGFVTKKSNINHIISAINLISNGQVYISQKALRKGQISSQGIDLPLKKLSQRELQVFKMLIKGFSVNNVARSLGLKQTTISTLKRRILVKMNVKNTAELVILSTKLGYN